MDRLGRLLAPLCTAALAACTAGSTGAPPINQVNPGGPGYAKLQLAVGSANLYGKSVGLNIVSTLRQPNGQSAIGVNTPTVTGPFVFAAPNQPAVGQNTPALQNPFTNGSIADVYTSIPNAGPSLPETNLSPIAIEGTPQTVAPGTPYCDYAGALPGDANPNPNGGGFTPCPGSFTPDATSFGQAGGVFAMGLAPYNAVAETGQAFSYVPYPQPFYETAHPPLIPWGGPPAFDPDGNGMGTRDGLFALGTDSFNENYFLGVGEGITAFGHVTPASGTYRLAVSVGIVGSGGTPSFTTFTASATLSNLTPLPTLATPFVTPDSNGDGGATFALTLPSGVTEALVQIVDYGPSAGPSQPPAANGTIATTPNCQGPKGTAFAPVYYTVVATSSGSYALPPMDGPNSSTTGGASHLVPSPSICTAAQNIAAKVLDGSGNPVTVGDNFTVQAIGFDYPAYEAALSLTQKSVPQTPVIAGASGQSDLTLSLPVEEDDGSGGYGATPLDARPLHPSVRRRTPRTLRPAPAGRLAPGIPAPLALRLR